MLKKPKKKVFVAVRLKPKTLEIVDKIADEKDETRSEIIRKLLETTISQYEVFGK